MKKMLFLPALLLLVPALCFAQWSTDPSVNNAINTGSGDQAIPKVVTCTNSDTYIGFFSNESGNYNVRLQRLDAQGNPYWAVGGILVSNHPQMTWLTDWDMAVDETGYAILAFQDIRNGGNNNVVAYRIAPDGSFAWGSDGIALSNSTAFDAAPKVVVTASGNAVFAWQADDVIIMQKVDAAGNLLWGAGGITLTTPDTYSWPQLMPVGTDDVILKYFHDTGPSYSPTRHVYAQRYDTDGDPVWASPAVISNAAGISAWTQIFPMLNDGSDGFYIAWHDDRDNNMDASVYVQHISSTGSILFQANGVEAATPYGRERMYPQLALPPGTTDIYVLWNEMDADQNNRGLYGQKLSPSGSRLWPTNGKVFIELSGTDVYPFAMRHSPTDVVALYEENSGGTDYHIKAMRIDANGDFVWTPGTRLMCSVSSAKVHPVANHYDNNQWIASWEDDRSGSSDIYAQNIQLDGSLGPYAPQTGYIEGTVTLVGGSGDVTQVEVTAGDVSVYPDQTGFYSMEILHGTYDVTASLAGYSPDTVFSVGVTIGQTSTGIDLDLDALPTGYIQGHVSLTGGYGDVTDVEVRAGSAMVHPDAGGNYTLEVWIGNYDVTASLATYTPDTVHNVEVLDGQTITGIDFSLEWVSDLGYIEGMVELQGGGGDLTQVTVTADTVSVHPDATGYYLMEIAAGTYDVTAMLSGYLTQTQMGIVVDTGQVTTDVDFFLYLAPNTGYIEGYVSLYNGTGDLTLAEVWAGDQMDHPAQDGFYHLAVDAGTYTVIASHPYALSDSITGVEVQAGTTTEDIDLALMINRADLVSKAFDIAGNPLNGVAVEITGPEGTYTGTITNDSIIFENLPYGPYQGWAWYESLEAVYAEDVLDSASHTLIFVIDITGLRDEPGAGQGSIHVFPNPSHGEMQILVERAGVSVGTLKIVDSRGMPVRVFPNLILQPGSNLIRWDGQDDSGHPVGSGLYFVVLSQGQGVSIARIIRY